MNETNNGRKGKLSSNSRIYIAYLAFCIAVLIFSSVLMSRLISSNTSSQINNILSLMSEKVNTSFEMMTNYIKQASDMLSAHSIDSWEQCYDELSRSTDDMPYESIGLIAPDGTVYGTAGEKLDFERRGFARAARRSRGIYITEPYRSSVTGANMITMTAPVYQNGERAGSVFISYYLETVQNLAYTNILSEKTSVVLMNPFSGNFVTCSSDGTSPPGTWGNIRLTKASIKPHRGYDYNHWIEKMRSKSPENIINFTQDGINYTQAFVKIDGMENWNIVIRIPMTELSDTMQLFTLGIITTAAILVLATLLAAALVYTKELRRSIDLQTLSDHDPLTKVMNRRAFETRLDTMFLDKSQLGRCTFIFFDIDYFKDVNDTYGHDAGDAVLYKTAQILSNAFEGTGIVARIGGDEFNVFVYKPLDASDIDNIMAQIRVQLKELHLDGGRLLPITFSSGLAIYPHDASELAELKKCADTALYWVKDSGRNDHAWYMDTKEAAKNKANKDKSDE